MVACVSNQGLKKPFALETKIHSIKISSFSRT
jgi:hypothetical protein